MLVAGASLSLIAPIAAQASDVLNIDGMSDYSRSKKSTKKRIDSATFINDTNEELATLKGHVDGLEAQQNDIEAGAFSSTTTMDGKAIMWGGAVKGADTLGDAETVQTGYTYTMNLNTSFTGDDNLYTRLKGGDAGGVWGLKETYHIDRKGTSDAFKVDKLWYTFPVGENFTVFAGPRIENYYMYITPSIYKPGALKSMKLGGNSNFGASTDVGFGFKYELDNGFAIASNIVDKSADGSGKLEGSDDSQTGGLLGEYSIRKWDTQFAYTTDRWHASATISDAQNWTSQSYNATALAAGMDGRDGDTLGLALRSYWRAENTGGITPDVSVGYDIKGTDNATDGNPKEASSWFIGLSWQDILRAEDRIGLAMTQPLKVSNCQGPCTTTDVWPWVWEAYYAFKPNDSMEIRPALFGGTDVEDAIEDDIFGTVVTTTFKF